VWGGVGWDFSGGGCSVEKRKWIHQNLEGKSSFEGKARGQFQRDGKKWGVATGTSEREENHLVNA